MGYGIRVYAFDLAGQIRRIPHLTFEHLDDGGTDKPIPEYAGKRIKIAMVFVRARNRKPVAILKVEYSIVSFDSKGCIDQEEKREAWQLSANSAAWYASEPKDILEQLRPSLSRLKYRDKFGWTPTQEEIRQIEHLIFR